jgi:ribosomal protein L2
MIADPRSRQGLRHLVHPHHPHLHAGPPLRELTLPLRRKGGRNDTGQVVNRAVGGGHRRRLRIVDFYRLESGEHDVVRVEYDPGRSAHIALIKRRGGKDVHEEEGARLAEVELDGAQAAETGLTTEQRWRKRDEVKGGWSYILAPEGLRAGDKVVSYRGGIPKGLVEGWDDAASDPASPQTQTQTIDAPESSTSRALGLLRTLTLKPGNVLPLYLIPAGTSIHNISLSAGGRMGGAQILNMGGGVDAEGKRTKKMGSVLVKLQSGEVRRFEPGCAATVGTVSK